MNYLVDGQDVQQEPYGVSSRLDPGEEHVAGHHEGDRRVGAVLQVRGGIRLIE